MYDVRFMNNDCYIALVTRISQEDVIVFLVGKGIQSLGNKTRKGKHNELNEFVRLVNDPIVVKTKRWNNRRAIKREKNWGL